MAIHLYLSPQPALTAGTLASGAVEFLQFFAGETDGAHATTGIPRDDEPGFVVSCHFSLPNKKPRRGGVWFGLLFGLQALAGQPAEHAIDDEQPDRDRNPVHVHDHPAQYRHKRLICCFDNIDIANSACFFHALTHAPLHQGQVCQQAAQAFFPSARSPLLPP